MREWVGGGGATVGRKAPARRFKPAAPDRILPALARTNRARERGSVCDSWIGRRAALGGGQDVRYDGTGGGERAPGAPSTTARRSTARHRPCTGTPPRPSQHLCQQSRQSEADCPPAGTSCRSLVAARSEQVVAARSDPLATTAHQTIALGKGSTTHILKLGEVCLLSVQDSLFLHSYSCNHVAVHTILN